MQLTRYNGQPAMELLGAPAPGVSSGAAMEAMEEIQAKLAAGHRLEWTGLSYEERLSGGQAPALYALSLLIVFLCLAALYESWSVPISVLLVVPLGDRRRAARGDADRAQQRHLSSGRPDHHDRRRRRRTRS